MYIKTATTKNNQVISFVIIAKISLLDITSDHCSPQRTCYSCPAAMVLICIEISSWYICEHFKNLTHLAHHTGHATPWYSCLHGTYLYRNIAME